MSIYTQSNQFYVYAYLREDYTPYYIGKGKGKRLYKKGKGEILPPKDKSRIIIVHDNLTEIYAFILERYYIRWFGRKDDDTGILRNRTDGGDGISGYTHTQETKKLISDKLKGNTNNICFNHTQETKDKISKINKGRVRSDETKKKMSIAHKGIRTSIGMTGKSHSADTKERMRQSALIREENKRLLKLNQSVTTDTVCTV
jgi:NUMOD3 motif